MMPAPGLAGSSLGGHAPQDDVPVGDHPPQAAVGRTPQGPHNVPLISRRSGTRSGGPSTVTALGLNQILHLQEAITLSSRVGV